MSKKHPPRLLQTITAGLLISGSALLLQGSAKLVAIAAALSGQGSSIVQSQAASSSEVLAPVTTQLPIEMFRVPTVELQLAVGMVLVLAGFGLHVLYIVKKKEHRKRLVRRLPRILRSFV